MLLKGMEYIDGRLVKVTDCFLFQPSIMPFLLHNPGRSLCYDRTYTHYVFSIKKGDNKADMKTVSLSVIVDLDCSSSGLFFDVTFAIDENADLYNGTDVRLTLYRQRLFIDSWLPRLKTIT